MTILTFLPAMLLPVLGQLGFANTTFGDADFAVLGIIIGKTGHYLNAFGIFALVFVLLLVLIIPNFMKTKSKVINNVDQE